MSSEILKSADGFDIYHHSVHSASFRRWPAARGYSKSVWVSNNPQTSTNRREGEEKMSGRRAEDGEGGHGGGGFQKSVKVFPSANIECWRLCRREVCGHTHHTHQIQVITLKTHRSGTLIQDALWLGTSDVSLGSIWYLQLHEHTRTHTHLSRPLNYSFIWSTSLRSSATIHMPACPHMNINTPMHTVMHAHMHPLCPTALFLHQLESTKCVYTASRTVRERKRERYQGLIY